MNTRMEGRAGLLLFLCSLPGQVVVESGQKTAEEQVAEAFTHHVKFVAHSLKMHGLVSVMNTAYDLF